MIAGVEQVFHLAYEAVHWTLSWCVPRFGVVQVQERGVKVSGAKTRLMEPGPFLVHDRLSVVYVTNVKRKVREPSDVVATTKDGVSVRVGISLAFKIKNVKTWLIDNEDAEQGLLVDVQRVVLDYVKAHTFDEIQAGEGDELTERAQKELGRYFGVEVRQLGITTFVETECRDLNHSGVVPGVGTSEDEEDDE